ncbi:spermatocyte protein spe-26-like isoform X1 [Dendronephthya gigantea]|uniref:spermatocyte protein spe-26-like isoform X1 n=1 Tax=Dendronephthya gigantea TaxID=151771 RepID=UPI00106B57FF|nr:spermatocyte protein spe-26-like isoform X1 [Dendronephthya gigantea]
MAQRMEKDEQGYDERRFEGTISEDLFCSICQGVLRNPRTCHKEHAFCHFCISEHLRHSHTCPECREHLTPETLKDPPRFMKNTLAALKIKCGYSERGCPGFVLLESLQNHVDKCGFAPVTCKNEGCGMEVNKRDKDLHEKDLCEFRIAKCHDCKEIRASQEETKKTVEVMKQSQAEMKVESNKMKDCVDQVKITQDEMKAESNKIKDCVDQVKVSQDETKEKVDEMRRSQARFEAEVKQQLERMTEMMNQLLQGNNLNNNINGASAMEPATVENNQDVIIIGGWYGPKASEVLNTVEKYNIVEEKSTPLPRLNHPRAESASCVYNNDVLVVGGYNGEEATDTIEVLKMNQHPLRWTMFDGKLPVILYSHDVIVYQGKLYTIGGYDWNKEKTSNAIYEIALTPPYAAKLLTKMPEARRNHRAELVNGKLFILGGTTSGLSKDAFDSVVVYDLTKNKFKPYPSLPQPVCGMSTVTWGHKIIVVGGGNKNDQVLNDVIMYDTETGRSERLPSMIYKRCGSSVVIMNDVIVVFGGWNKEQGDLNSVESFTIGGGIWKELPGMMEKRHNATAVVKPHN